MKENKKGRGLKILVVILFILLLCLVGYIVYDKLLIDNNEINSNKVEENKANIDNKDESDSQEDKNIGNDSNKVSDSSNNLSSNVEYSYERYVNSYEMLKYIKPLMKTLVTCSNDSCTIDYSLYNNVNDDTINMFLSKYIVDSVLTSSVGYEEDDNGKNITSITKDSINYIVKSVFNKDNFNINSKSGLSTDNNGIYHFSWYGKSPSSDVNGIYNVEFKYDNENINKVYIYFDTYYLVNGEKPYKIGRSKLTVENQKFTKLEKVN